MRNKKDITLTELRTELFDARARARADTISGEYPEPAGGVSHPESLGRCSAKPLYDRVSP